MKALSLFSGIGGFDLGLERAGFEMVGQCDNDPFCNKVLAKHWPGVPRYDDVRSIGLGPSQRDQQGEPHDGKANQPDIARAGHVDLVCGGFPCQDLSVAGKRAGLAGGRSGLWFEFHRILSELRPTFCIVENVPGLLSSNSGRDFAVLLSGLGQLWPAVGWAILDSQHFGVPQRRRRVYVIGGPSRECVQQILSVCESGDWHPAKGRAPGEDVAPTLRAGANQTGGHRPPGTDVDTVETLQVVARTLRGATERQPPRRHRHVHSTKTASPTRSTALMGRAVLTSSVRRLTPVECERLQGFPDDWTKLDENTADGPRYKACGNAVSVPVIEYLGRRILEVT